MVTPDRPQQRITKRQRERGARRLEQRQHRRRSDLAVRQAGRQLNAINTTLDRRPNLTVATQWLWAYCRFISRRNYRTGNMFNSWSWDLNRHYVRNRMRYSGIVFRYLHYDRQIYAAVRVRFKGRYAIIGADFRREIYIRLGVQP